MSGQERDALRDALGVMEQAVSEMGPAARTQNPMLIGERADDMVAAMRPSIKRVRAALSARDGTERPPGPPKPPRVPGHMGYPRAEVIKAAQTVFGALVLLEEMGVDVGATRRAWVRHTEDIGLREADLKTGNHDASHKVERSTSGMSARCIEPGCDWSYEYA